MLKRGQPTMNELTVKKLSKSFKDNKVLNSIDFTVSETK